jgi:thiol-disulfide isomerase/thioredoxin
MNPSSSQDFLSTLEKNQSKLILLSFTKSTCPACSQLKQYIETVKPKYNDKIEFINLDTKIFKKLANDNNIEYVPTSYLINYKKGKVVWSSKKIIGLNPKEIESVIQNKINSN